MKLSIPSYANCTRCGLHNFRRNIVLGRGDIPAEIFVVGEAPGKSEDLLGQPFVGPSGKLLDTAIEKAKELSDVQNIRMFITNVVACRPCNASFAPNREPTKDEAWACWERLEETYKQVKPRRVLLLGDTAKQNCRKVWPFAKCLRHPAAILRAGGVTSAEFKTFVRTLSDTFEEVYRV